MPVFDIDDLSDPRLVDFAHRTDVALKKTGGGIYIAESALVRAESRGGHFRSDHPLPRREWAGLHVRVVAHESDVAGAGSGQS